MAKMQAVQVPYANGPLELVEREIPKPPPGHVKFKNVKLVAFATVTPLLRRGHFPELSFLVFPVMRWQG